MAKKPEPKPEDPRQRVRIYRDGLTLIKEFYLDPNQKVIDLDLYLTATVPDVTLHLNYPGQQVKDQS